ncbi:hypothetical protein [Actinomadura citrea]|uniref:Uncharacterized protein n=1 Tax=Actinomadura citrea TaxID=46158 RepID=A0A7Y9GHX0_9ACTN|nr:hypothetical protein [Actinomadura citrea]NYE16802.1 hypothetical protein [Actinomadura citrea]
MPLAIGLGTDDVLLVIGALFLGVVATMAAAKVLRFQRFKVVLFGLVQIEGDPCGVNDSTQAGQGKPDQVGKGESRQSDRDRRKAVARPKKGRSKAVERTGRPD